MDFKDVVSGWYTMGNGIHKEVIRKETTYKGTIIYLTDGTKFNDQYSADVEAVAEWSVKIPEFGMTKAQIETLMVDFGADPQDLTEMETLELFITNNNIKETT